MTGMAIRFHEEDVRLHGRPAYGVSRHGPRQGDYIVGMATTPKGNVTEKKNGKDGEQHPDMILSVTENGFGKRTPIGEYREQSRGGKGVINVKTTERNGKVVGILLVDLESEAMVHQPLRQDHPD